MFISKLSKDYVMLTNFLPEMINHGKSKAFTDGVVIGQTIISSPHNVQRGQISAGELHGAKQVVPDVGAEHGIFTLRNLASQAHQDLVNGVRVQVRPLGVPPGGAQAEGVAATAGLLVVTLLVTAVDARRNCGVTKPEIK